MNQRFYPLADYLHHGVLVAGNGERAVARFIPKTRASRLSKESRELLAKIESEALLPSRLG